MASGLYTIGREEEALKRRAEAKEERLARGKAKESGSARTSEA